MNNPFETKTYGKIIAGLAVLVIALIIFSAGIFVGYTKATFSKDMDDVYRQGFTDPGSPFAPFMHYSDDISSHGIVGQIVSTNLPTSIMIKGGQNAEQIVALSPETTVRIFHTLATTSDIKTGDQAIVIGTPNEQGEIEASFIRIIPPPPNATDTASSIGTTSGKN